MRGLVIFLTVIVASLIFAAIGIKDWNETKPKQENHIVEFSTFTSAVCEHKDNSVHCKDELFVNCNGNISKANDIIECNGIRLDSYKVTGFAVFDKDWVDPRN